MASKRVDSNLGDSTTSTDHVNSPNRLLDYKLADFWITLMERFLDEQDIRRLHKAEFYNPRVKYLASVASFCAQSREQIDTVVECKQKLTTFKANAEIIYNELKERHKNIVHYAVINGAHVAKEYLSLLLRVLDMFVMGQCGRIVAPHLHMCVEQVTIREDVFGVFPGTTEGDHLDHHNESLTTVSVNGFFYLREIALSQVKNILNAVKVSN